MLDQSRPETQVIVVAPANDRTCCGRNGTGDYPVPRRIIATGHPRLGSRPRTLQRLHDLQHRFGMPGHLDATPFANERPFAVDDERAALDAAHVPAGCTDSAIYGDLLFGFRWGRRDWLNWFGVCFGCTLLTLNLVCLALRLHGLPCDPCVDNRG